MGSTPGWGLPYPEADTLITDSAAIVQDLAEKMDLALTSVIPLGRRVDRFTSSGTWVCPVDVTYAIAHIRAGGGGGGSSGGNGGTGGSSDALGLTALGGNGAARGPNSGYPPVKAAPANSGAPGIGACKENGGRKNADGQAGTYLVHGSTVTPGVGYTIVVGAGGTSPNYGGPGGSGFVWIEYEVTA